MANRLIAALLAGGLLLSAFLLEGCSGGRSTRARSRPVVASEHPAVGEAGRITEAPVFRPDSTVASDSVRISYGWYRNEGLELHGILFEPVPQAGPDRRPGIVFNHGGVSGISPDVISRARELAGRGYVVFAPSYRGEDGSQGEIEVAGGEVRDVLAAFRILLAHPEVDRERVGMLGSSHGALITVLCMSRDRRIRAGVAAYGVMDIEAWYRWLLENDRDVSDSLSVRIYGKGPEDRPEAFLKRSARRAVVWIEAPLLLVHGSKDTIVPVEQAVRFGELLDAVGHPDHRIEVYPLLGHNFLFWTSPGMHTSEEMEEAGRAWKDVVSFLDRELQLRTGS